MKRILFIIPSLTLGGLERVQVTIANALAKKGYDVTVMTLDKGCDLLPQLDKRVRYIYKPYKPHKTMKKIPYIRNKLYDDGMWETRTAAKTLYKYYVGNEKYDVEIAFFRGLPIKIISGSTNKDAIHLAWVHSDFKKASGYLNNFKSLKSVKKAYESYDHVVAVSKQAEESFLAVMGDTKNTKVIYNMLPTEEIKKQSLENCEIKKQKFTIVSVGHLIDVKGYDRLLNAVKLLNDDGFDFELWIVGYGEDEDKLKQFLKSNNIDNVKFLGYQINPYPFMKQADLYVCSSRYEGYNLTVAEALILGVPVLSTNCTGPNEILDGGKYGMIVDNSEEGLYNGMRELLENIDLLREYKEKTKLRQDFFDEDRVLKQIFQLF
jgi:glycosyltransferase involved in cell wall biosynthesis